ncbi:MAG: MBL fold metallo-hydrolase [Candidatus Levybacteria bacterium]|nr:MBL fold metallo-hydrolase [Candidatus Levybacteria bacterium]
MNKLTFVIIAVIIVGVVGYYIQNNGKQEVQMEKAQSADTIKNPLQVTPISHATMVLPLGGQVIYTDPVGGREAFVGQPAANIILITDIHGDHMDIDTLNGVSKEDTILIVPQAVADMLPEELSGTVVILANGATTTQKGIAIEAVPMYNVPESADAFHTKGRGNGYVLEAEGKRIYIAGDTSVTPEMQALQNIDVAFIPMNLPYTMNEEEAAAGVVAFKPKVVHPYHYQGQDGLADVNKFKELVQSKNPNIQVELLNFYPK